MQYQVIFDEILNMKCIKIYKPILILSYINFIKLSQNNKYQIDLMVDLNDLIPLIRYYLSQGYINESSMGIKDLSTKHIFKTIVSGPLYRIQNDTSIFHAEEIEGVEYFGLITSNETIHLPTLLDTIESACIELIQSYFDSFTGLNLSKYSAILTEIRNTQIAPGTPPKIYKYLLILSLLDYYLALGDDINPFNIKTDIDNLVIYYKLNLSTDLFGTVIENKKIVSGTNKLIKEHIQTMPLRKLCNSSQYFLNNDKNPKSRRKEDYPTFFQIKVSTKLDSRIMVQMIRSTCYELIQYHTGSAAEKSIINKINESSNYFSNSTARKGQKEYRNTLLERYSCTCALCNLDFDPVLVASHAKPWRDCNTTHEKLSPDNGLLLCSYHDDLFDKGYISFDTTNGYEIVFSSSVTKNVLNTFEVSYENKVPLFVQQNPRMKKYLDYHNDYIFKK